MSADRYTVTRANGHEVETVRDLNGVPLSLRTALLIQERDRMAGTRSTIGKDPDVRPSGRMVAYGRGTGWTKA